MARGTDTPGHVSTRTRQCAGRQDDPAQGCAQIPQGRAGITGLETAIILIAFVVVAAVFAFVVLSTGLFSAERSKETVLAGLAKTRGSMGLSGSVIATSNGTETHRHLFRRDARRWGIVRQLGSGGHEQPDRRLASSTTAFASTDLTYTTTVITGDADDLLEPGELFEITLTGIERWPASTSTRTTHSRLQVQPPSGATW